MELAQIYPFHGASQELFFSVQCGIAQLHTGDDTDNTIKILQRSPKFWSSFLTIDSASSPILEALTPSKAHVFRLWSSQIHSGKMEKLKTEWVNVSYDLLAT